MVKKSKIEKQEEKLAKMKEKEEVKQAKKANKKPNIFLRLLKWLAIGSVAFFILIVILVMLEGEDSELPSVSDNNSAVQGDVVPPVAVEEVNIGDDADNSFDAVMARYEEALTTEEYKDMKEQARLQWKILKDNQYKSDFHQRCMIALNGWQAKNQEINNKLDLYFKNISVGGAFYGSDHFGLYDMNSLGLDWCRNQGNTSDHLKNLINDIENKLK